MSRDLPVIYCAADIGEADIVVSWLAERGIAAAVKDRFAATTFEVSQIASPAGIEVCGLDPTQVESARELLSQHFDEKDEVASRPINAEPVDAECEECNKKATYPGAARGRVDECPTCGAYVDVPE